AALKGRAQVVERDLTALVEEIAERKFSIVELRSTFERWLTGAGGLEPGTYVHVVEGAAAAVARSTEAGVAPPIESTARPAVEVEARVKRKPRKPALLAQGLRAWAAARGLD